MATRRAADDRQDSCLRNLPPSRIFETLGTPWFAPFPAVKTPGKVIWFNLSLARELGFDVPSSNRMTPRFHRRLIDALSYRALPRTVKSAARGAITLLADKYGGEGLGTALGAGRSGFLPHANLYVKGVGITPLYRTDTPDDLFHSHGGMQINDCLGEAIFGEVNQHLLTSGSTRILAVIDQGRNVAYPHGKVPLALAIRSGTQLRPGHLLARKPRRSDSLLDIFVRMTRETGQLVAAPVAATGDQLPDLHATMLRIVHDHARTWAEQFRWRMVHGAVTASNLEMSGAFLDLTTQSAQPRTAPVCFATDTESFFGREHTGCAKHLQPAFRALIDSIPTRQRRPLNARAFDVRREMEKAYDEHLQLQLLAATGLKTDLAGRLKTEHPVLSRRFKEVLLAMSALKNPGPVAMVTRVVDDVSVLDVFNLLRDLPKHYFAAPAASHAREIRAALRPILKGNRPRVATKRARVGMLIHRLDRAYCQVMKSAESWVKEYYGTKAHMRRSIIARADFENRPIELYRTTLYQKLDDAIETYRSTGKSAAIHQAVETQVSAAIRKIDALLVQGGRRLLSDGGLELEMRTVNGVDYSIRAWNDRRQKRCLRVTFPIARAGPSFATPLPGYPRLTSRNLRSLRYHFTMDGWASSFTVDTRLEKDAAGRPVIATEEISDLPIAGRLQGFFSLDENQDPSRARAETYGPGYTFAVPDKQELAKLLRATR